MILYRILDRDIHKMKTGGAIPLMLETSALPEFVPAIVSGSRGQFLVVERLADGNKLRSGIFVYDSEKIDDVIPHMFSVAYELSVSREWQNVVTGRASIKRAFDYVADQFQGQPHVCLIPDSWDSTKIRKTFGVKNLSHNDLKYEKHCRLMYAKVPFPIFLSRPDMVGMHTQFVGTGKSSIILHNVMRGMSFCPDCGDESEFC